MGTKAILYKVTEKIALYTLRMRWGQGNRTGRHTRRRCTLPRAAASSRAVSTRRSWPLDKSTDHSDNFENMHRRTIAGEEGDAGRCVNAPGVAVGYDGVPRRPFVRAHPTTTMAFFALYTGADSTIPTASADLYVSKRLHIVRTGDFSAIGADTVLFVSKEKGFLNLYSTNVES